MKKISIIALCCIVVLSSAILSGCRKKTDTNSDSGSYKKIVVYTSIYPMYDFSKKIGGDRIEVHNLVPAGTEPHDWEPTPRDIAKIQEADVLIYNGAGMEGWIEKVLKSIENKQLIVAETSKGLSLIKNQETHDHDHLEYDPHVWLSPMMAKKQMEIIKDALVKADPSNSNFFEINFEENSKKLESLDKDYRETTAGFSQKDIVVSHEAFGYLCEEYGLNQVGIEGLNADSEPSAARMVEIVDFVKKRNVKVIFFEKLISPKIAQTIAKTAGVDTAVLNPLGGLSEDEIMAGKEYFSVMQENLKALKTALE